jgi:hypothetical protein
MPEYRKNGARIYDDAFNQLFSSPSHPVRMYTVQQQGHLETPVYRSIPQNHRPMNINSLVHAVFLSLSLICQHKMATMKSNRLMDDDEDRASAVDINQLRSENPNFSWKDLIGLKLTRHSSSNDYN